MTTFCQCLFETATVVSDGVVKCFVCCQPKRRVWPDLAMPIPEAAAAIGLGESTLRGLLASGSIQPTYRDERKMLVRPAHALAQMSQKGIK